MLLRTWNTAGDECSMSRPLRSFPLPSTHKAKLSEAGYETVEDLKSVRVGELSRGRERERERERIVFCDILNAFPELSVSHAEALEILRVVRSDPAATSRDSHRLSGPGRGTHSRGLSALELLKMEQQQAHIVTFCASMDEMLGGGVPMGKITEFCGAPGIGKTQIRY